MFIFATDAADEGVEVVLDNIQHRAGLDGVTVAAAYHHGRDIFPHNPVRKVYYLEGGAVFFRPNTELYAGTLLRPHVSRLAQERDILGELLRDAEKRQMPVDAWTVFLHNHTLGEQHPDCTTVNAFGDRYLTDLCPANPAVRTYAKALVTDIAQRGVRSVVAESLHYHPLEHGFHHERYLVELGAAGRFLLGLCFCNHCMDAARSANVDIEAIKRFTQTELTRLFEREAEVDSGELDRTDVGPLAGGEMEGFLEVRGAVVASLVEEISDGLDGLGTQLDFIDTSGALKGYASGRPQGLAAPSIAWRFGIDIPRIAKVALVTGAGYAADIERLELDLRAYLALIQDPARLGVVLRPAPPDCDSVANLAAKLVLVRDHGLSQIGFYHYGLMRLTALDRINSALVHADTEAFQRRQA